jgi:hypothetical protein
MFDVNSVLFVNYAVDELERAIEEQFKRLEQGMESEKEELSTVEGISLLVAVKSFLVEAVEDTINGTDNLRKLRDQLKEGMAEK